MTAKKGLIVLGILLTISFSLFLTVPIYAKPEFGDNCISCHTKGGITLTSNITDTVEVRSSSSFEVQVEAEGVSEELTIIWSAVAGNPSFSFTPSRVVDNGSNDLNPAENKVRVIFKVTTPQIQGKYTIQVFAAGGGGKGGTLTIPVIVISEGLPKENLLPTAYFLYTRHGMKIEFEDRSWDIDGNITSWLWKFGDCNNSTEQNPTHVFTEPGTYTVVLTVTDDQGGTSTESKTFTMPSKNERLMLWTLQVFAGSIIIGSVFVGSIIIGSIRFSRMESNNKKERK